MQLGIQGKKVLIVGASRGIGRAIALAYAKEGGRVAAVARDENALCSLVSEMGGTSAGHACYVADLMVDDAPKTLAAHILNEFGSIDIVVHNIGGPLEVRNPLAPMTAWRQVWQFNAGIAIEMNELLIPPMIQRQWGRVIHISSISATFLRGCPAYASAKAFVNAYTTTLGRAIADTGVVVSALMPGAVAFPGSYWDKRAQREPEVIADFLRHHQGIGRMGTPEEIACFAVFMGSEVVTFAQAALIPVDGANM
jgi:3-oxoacyl-[acyl-carrier protein] reductase